MLVGTLLTLVCGIIAAVRFSLHASERATLAATERARYLRKLEAQRVQQSLADARRARRKDRIVFTPGRLTVGMSGTASPADVEDVYPAVKAKSLQDAAAAAAQRLGTLRRPLDRVIVVVTRCRRHAMTTRCDVSIFDSEAKALQAISRLGGNKSGADTTPLRRISGLHEDDAKDLADAWETAPWDLQAVEHNGVEAAVPVVISPDAVPLLTVPETSQQPATLGSPRTLWSQWVDIERNKQELNLQLTVREPDEPDVPSLSLRRVSSWGTKDERQATRRQQLAARAADAPWNRGEALTWRADELPSPGRDRASTWRGMASLTAPLEGAIVLPVRSMSPPPRSPPIMIPTRKKPDTYAVRNKYAMQSRRSFGFGPFGGFGLSTRKKDLEQL